MRKTNYITIAVIAFSMLFALNASAASDKRVEMTFLLLKSAEKCVFSELDKNKNLFKNFNYGYRVVGLYPINDEYESNYTGDFEKVVFVSMRIDRDIETSTEHLQIDINSIRDRCYPDKASSSSNLHPKIHLHSVVDVNTTKPIYLKIHNGEIFKWEYSSKKQ